MLWYVCQKLLKQLFAASSYSGTLPLFMHFSSLNESFGTGPSDEMNIFDVEGVCCLQQLVEMNTHTSVDVGMQSIN